MQVTILECLLPKAFVGGLGGFGQLGGSGSQTFLRLFQIFFNLLYLPVQGSDFGLSLDHIQILLATLDLEEYD